MNEELSAYQFLYNDRSGYNTEHTMRFEVVESQQNSKNRAVSKSINAIDTQGRVNLLFGPVEAEEFGDFFIYFMEEVASGRSFKVEELFKKYRRRKLSENISLNEEEGND